MKRKKFRHRWKRKLLVVLLLVFCFATFVVMESQYSSIKMLTLISLPSQKPKIAFLFIARNRIPLDMVWDVFFQVDWGEASMIQAERILLQNALTDPINERFLFLSDGCIPLYNFSYIYDYIMSASTSFVDSFADTKESRYNPRMHPVIPVDNWRKGSQWVVLTRKHARIVVEDETKLDVFLRDITNLPFCFLYKQKRSLPEFWRDHPQPVDASKEHNCVPDEHYVQTLLAQKGLEGEITRRSLTHSSWDLSSSKDPKRRGWHPVTYKLADATSTLIESIKGVDNIYYETEYRREWCTSKGKPSQCFLFARKFTRPAALRFLICLLWAFPGKQQEVEPDLVGVEVQLERNL
ncbi:Glycosyltransferase BC10 [Sesamum angolense]|uniref:Glycosyltransferase BC10 n=1 Tax=Sesamum angolense TaxID=2727404 RepID=A0AAE1WGM5_9LAMI|nr:Glycosyltransferase BC10 [Sesamum angolense]